MKTLQEQAESMLETIDSADATKKYARLKPEDRALIFRLAARGHLTQAEIAKAVGCDPATVCRTLKLLDTRKEARAILESGAARLADTVVTTDDAGIALKALGKLDVVRDDKADVAGAPAFYIHIGGPPVTIFFDGDVIDASFEVLPPHIGDGPPPPPERRAIHLLRGQTSLSLPDSLGLADVPPHVQITDEARQLLEARAASSAIDVTPRDAA